MNPIRSVSETSIGTFFWVFLLVVSFFLGFLFRSDGGINLDTLVYVRQAIRLPGIDSIVFPPGYPALLRLFRWFTPDYFWASKFLNLTCLLVLVGFSWSRKFFFPQTLVLLSLKAGAGLWPFSFSEIPFLTILYFQLYFLHRLFREGDYSWIWSAAMAALMLGLLLVRHAGIFLFAGYLVLGFGLILFRKKIQYEGLRAYFRFLVISGGWILVYLFANYLAFHSFFGEDLRGAPEIPDPEAFSRHLLLNLKGLLSSWNPFYTLVFEHGQDGGVRFLATAVWIFDVFFLIGFLGLIGWQRKNLDVFAFCLFVLAFSFFGLVFASSFKAGIEVLNTRLLAPGMFCLYLGCLVLVDKDFHRFRNLMSGIALFSLAFNTGFLLKTPANYLAIRKEAKATLARHPGARYLILDSDEIPVTRYRIPLTEKTLQYRHPVLSKAYINRHALGILKPDLQWIEGRTDTILTQETLFNSRIHLSGSRN